MADTARQIAEARKAGYSEAEIVAHLGQTDPRVAKAKQAGYDDKQIVGFLTTQSNTGVGIVDRANNRRMAQYYGSQVQGQQNRAARAAGENPIFQFAKDFAAPAKNALAGLREGYAQETERGAPRSLGDVAQREKQMLRTAGNALGLVVSPLTGALDATIIKPAARGLEQAGIGDEASNASAINNALLAVKPGVKSAPKVRVPSPIQETVQQFERAGVEPNLAAAKGKGSASVTNLIAENALAGKAVRGRLARQSTQAGAAAGRQAAGYGAARGAANAGEGVQGGIRRFANDGEAAGSFKAKSSQLYDNAFSAIEGAEAEQVGRLAKAKEATDAARAARTAEREALVSRTVKDAELESARRGYRVEPEPVPQWDPLPANAPPPAVRTTQTSSVLADMTGRVNAKPLAAIIVDPRLQKIAGALEAGGGDIRFADLRALRTWVREAKGNPQLRQSINRADLARLESSLTTDIYEAANRLGGPQALHNLRRADQYYAAGSSRIQNALKPFESAKSGESAYSRILQSAGSTSSADIRKVVSLKRSLAPDEWGDVAATIVSDMGKPTAGAAGVADDAFSVSSFMTNYNRLSPRGREALFGSLGGGGSRATSLKAELDNLAAVVDRLKAVEKGANVSKSGVQGQNVAMLLGGYASLPVTIKVLGSMAGAGEILTNPAFVRWLARTPKNPAAMGVHMTKLDALVATYPQLAGYREELRKELNTKQVGQDNGPDNYQPAGAVQPQLQPAP